MAPGELRVVYPRIVCLRETLMHGRLDACYPGVAAPTVCETSLPPQLVLQGKLFDTTAGSRIRRYTMSLYCSNAPNAGGEGLRLYTSQAIVREVGTFVLNHDRPSLLADLTYGPPCIAAVVLRSQGRQLGERSHWSPSETCYFVLSNIDWCRGTQVTRIK